MLIMWRSCADPLCPVCGPQALRGPVQSAPQWLWSRPGAAAPAVHTQQWPAHPQTSVCPMGEATPRFWTPLAPPKLTIGRRPCWGRGGSGGDFAGRGGPGGFVWGGGGPGGAIWGVHAPKAKRWAGRKLLCGGGGDTEAHFPNPPPPLLGRRDGRGGSGQGCPTCRAWGGGVNPTSMAQNDTHVALISLTTQMWWGGELLVEKTFSGQKFCVPAPSPPTSVLTQNKGPDTEPHFSNPPPLLRRASMSAPPPPPPAEQFSGCLGPSQAPFTSPCPPPNLRFVLDVRKQSPIRKCSFALAPQK